MHSLEEVRASIWRIVHSGLMETVAHETYGFQHQTLQEYFASVELARQLVSEDWAVQNNAWSLVNHKYTYSRWIEILRLHTGVLAQEYGQKGVAAVKRWLNVLTQQALFPEDDPGKLGLILAVKTLGEVDMEEIEQKVTQIWTEELLKTSRRGNTIQQRRLLDLTYDICRLHPESSLIAKNTLTNALHEKNDLVRSVAVEALGRLGEYTSTEMIIAALGDNSIWVRCAAIEVIREMEERAPIGSLLQTAFTDPSLFVYMEAVHALGYLKAYVPRDQVLLALVNIQSHVRRIAVMILGVLQDPLFLGNIYDCLWDDNKRVRSAAIWALGEFGRQQNINTTLIETMLDDESSLVRFEAVRVLGKHGKQTSIEKIVKALEDEDHGVRTEAVYTLGLLGEQAPIERLLTIMKESNDEDMQEAVLEALGELHAFVSPAPIIAALDNWDTRDTAIKALGQFGKRAPLESLFEALVDTNRSTRAAAAEALKNLKGYVSEEQIISMLNTHIQKSRVAAVHILGRLEENAPQDLLLEVLNDRDPQVRNAARDAMMKVAKHLSPEIVEILLAHPEPFYRRIAISALGEKENNIHLARILSMSVDEDKWMRIKALESLRKRVGDVSQHEIPVNTVLLALEDEDVQVRSLAITTLWDLKKHITFNANIINRVIAALEDRDWLVRWEVINIWGETIPRKRIISALKDENVSVRMSALSFLKRTREGISMKAFQRVLKDKHDEVRCIAVEYLACLGKNIPTKFVVDAMQDKSPQVRAAAAKIAGSLGENAPIEQLLAMRDDDDEYVCAQAREAAQKLGKYLGWDTFFNDSDPLARTITIKVLGEGREDNVLTQFIHAMKDESADVRAAAVEAMGKLGDQAAKEEILKALVDKDGYVRKIALETVETLGIAIPANVLLTVLKNEDSEDTIRIAAIERLGDLREPDAVEPILAVMNDTDERVRRVAIKALGKLQEFVSPHHFIEALYDTDEHIRKTAVVLLHDVEEVDLSDHIFLLLGDSNEEVRSAALQMLRKTHLREVIDEVRAVLQGKKSKLLLESVSQGFIAETLGNIELALPGLLKKLADLLEWPHWQVQMNAARSLGKIHHNIPADAIHSLYKLRHSPYPKPVRQAADEALANILSLETGIEDNEL